MTLPEPSCGRAPAAFPGLWTTCRTCLGNASGQTQSPGPIQNGTKQAEQGQMMEGSTLPGKFADLFFGSPVNNRKPEKQVIVCGTVCSKKLFFPAYFILKHFPVKPSHFYDGSFEPNVLRIWWDHSTRMRSHALQSPTGNKKSFCWYVGLKFVVQSSFRGKFPEGT